MKEDKKIQIVLDTLIREHGMLAVLRQLEIVCRKRSEKVSGDDAGEWQAAAKEVSSAWGNLCELDLLKN